MGRAHLKIDLFLYTPSIITMSAPANLPIIDISAFVRPDIDPAVATVEKRATAQRIHEACRDCGFFYLTGHGVEPEVMERVLRLTREFFARPVEEKVELSIAGNDQARLVQIVVRDIKRV